ncbi:MAG: FKBP-type peptidyl-prolyl cis-trans isomerase [Bacteroidales bacterium]|nr:FKBP-type peptidyl-prolyl cis-trans isomerase [Bacteroidales bacterium]
MDKVSYALGLNIGQQLKQMGLKGILNVEDFASSIKDTLEGNELKVSMSEAQQVLNTFFAELEKKQRAAAAEAGKAAREEGEKFLAENAKKAGIITTASGLQYEVLTEGTGKQPKAENTVRCHYEGRLINGKIFDSSYRRGEPADFGLRQVIKGWTEGVQLMKEGSKFRFYIPYNLAYGENGAGADIPPYAALIFDVELIKVL